MNNGLFELVAVYVLNQYTETLEKDYKVFIYVRNEEYAKVNINWNALEVT